MKRSRILPLVFLCVVLAALIAVRLTQGSAQTANVKVTPAAAAQSEGQPDESRLANRRDGWGRPVKLPVKGQKSNPAPKRDISGIWDPGDGGIQALGPAAMPEDGKPEH